MAAAANGKLVVGGAFTEKLPEGQVNGDHLVPPVSLGCKCRVSFSVLISSSKPWRKKVLAVAAYRHAKVAWKRRVKAQEEEQGLGVAQHPEDVLQLVFSHLDLRSLAYAEMVCRSWCVKQHAKTIQEAPGVSIPNGVVMGGGAGVSIHGRFRVATEKSVGTYPNGVVKSIENQMDRIEKKPYETTKELKSEKAYGKEQLRLAEITSLMFDFSIIVLIGSLLRGLWHWCALAVGFLSSGILYLHLHIPPI